MGSSRSSASVSGTASRRASAAGATSATATTTSSSRRASESASKTSAAKASAASGVRKSTKSVPEPEPEDESEEEYEVEAIVAHKKHKTTGKLKFCLKWKGFPESDNTWEDEENLNCKELVSNYLREKGLDSRGNELKPSAASSTPSATATRKRTSSAASTSNSHGANAPAAKRSKTAPATTTHSANSPRSTPSSSSIAMPSSSDIIDNLVQLDPSAKSWDDLFTVDTIGYENQHNGATFAQEHSGNDVEFPYYVYGTMRSTGQKTCETLKDVREKAPQRLLDFLLQHLKFR